VTGLFVSKGIKADELLNYRKRVRYRGVKEITTIQRGRYDR
jgi:hypothetical protein